MRKLLGALAIVALLPVLSAPALASSATPARMANIDNCNPNTSYCDELLVAQTSGGDNIWIYGGTHNVEMGGANALATPSIWSPVPNENGWYYVQTEGAALYWTAANPPDGGTVGIFPEGFISGDTHQYWHLEPSGTSHIIENYWVTTHWGVTCCEDGDGALSDLRFDYGHGNYELWNFRS